VIIFVGTLIWFIKAQKINIPSTKCVYVLYYSHSTTTLLAGYSSCRLFPVPKLKSTFKGRRFGTTEIKENSRRALKAIPKQVFQDCFKNWKKRGEVY
jgi:hypothetical protein